MNARFAPQIPPKSPNIPTTLEKGAGVGVKEVGQEEIPMALEAVKVVGEETNPDLHVVWLQKSMDQYGVPWIIQKFLCWVYNRYGWAANARSADGTWLNIEEMGVFDEAGDAYWAANQAGEAGIGMCVEAPHNRLGPLATVKYGNLSCPQSQHQNIYRDNRRLPAVVLPRDQIDRLAEKIRATDHLIDRPV